MKSSEIFDTLSLAQEIRRNGGNFNPLFIGASGLGKSAVIRSWADSQRKINPSFGFIDLRVALLEAPDLIGLTEIITDQDGRKRTSHCLPEFWPTSGEGILLFEEPNRGTTSILNTLMSILQEREVKGFKIPEGWILAGAINPDSSSYDVGTMDAALKDRFVSIEVKYDHKEFLQYMKDNEYCDFIQLFVGSGIWTYREPESLGEGITYISKRTWSKVNDIQKTKVKDNPLLHKILISSILGEEIGSAFYKFITNDRPVTAEDLIADKKQAIQRLISLSADGERRGDLLSASIDSILSKKEIKLATILDVAEVLPADLSISLISRFIMLGGKDGVGATLIKVKAELGSKRPLLAKRLNEIVSGSETLPEQSKKNNNKPVATNGIGNENV